MASIIKSMPVENRGKMICNKFMGNRTGFVLRAVNRKKNETNLKIITPGFLFDCFVCFIFQFFFLLLTHQSYCVSRGGGDGGWGGVNQTKARLKDE